MQARPVRSLFTTLLAAIFASVAIAPPARADALTNLTNAQLAAEWQIAWTVYRFYQRLPPPGPLSLRRQVHRTLTIDIDVDIDHVFEVYSDIDNHIGRHSFLKGVVTHEERVEGDVHIRNFTAIEDVPLVGVPVRLHTHAQQRTYEDQYYYEADSYDAPDVITHQVITFADLGGGRTRVTESLVFETNAALIDFTVSNGVSAHEVNMQRLKADLEAGVL